MLQIEGKFLGKNATQLILFRKFVAIDMLLHTMS